jgi:hypothetical protein
MRATKNMLAWWPGEGTWDDVVGGRTLTPIDGALNTHASVYGRGFNIERSGADFRRANTASRVPVTGDHWACVWVNFAALTTGSSFNYILAQTGGSVSGSSKREFSLAYSPAHSAFRAVVFNNAAGGFGLNGSSMTVNTNTWYHVGLQVLTGTSSFEIWVNGRVQASAAYTGTINEAATEMVFGTLFSDAATLVSHCQGRVKNPIVGLGILGAGNWARLASNMHPLEAS